MRQGVQWVSLRRLPPLRAFLDAELSWHASSSSAQIIPGGWLSPPQASSSPLLDVQVTPRHSIYVGNETTAEFIVDAALSYYYGSAYPSGNVPTGSNASDSLGFTVAVQDTILVSGTVGVNTTDNLFPFNLSQLTPSTTAYVVTLTGSTPGGGNYTASSELFYLPVKTTGSVVKVDRLYSSILYSSSNTGGVFTPYFPYGYYGTYSGYFNVTGNPTAYADEGFNAVNIVSDFSDGDMTYTLDEMDGLDLLLQYDMRNSYQNLTSVAEQVPLVQDHPSLLTYYTADEPDGWGYTFASTTDAYDLLATLDKYHPTALVLNCQNYYFGEYTAGADIIMEDAYPVGVNTTYSTKWDTAVNRTYGDCGCDNCVQSWDLLNVAARVDDFKTYATWLNGDGNSSAGAARRKPVWAVPQAFSGEGYWSRDPTAEETWAMDLLAFNHGAKGRLAWIYPPSAVLGNATAALSRVVTVSPVLEYLTGANPVLLQDGRAAGNGSSNGLDVAYWSTEEGVLVGVVNPVNSSSAVQIALPGSLAVSEVASTPWGNTSWTLDGSTLTAVGGVSGLATSYVILQ